MTRTERLVGKPGRSPNVELIVEGLGAQGDEIARLAGEPVFVPFTVPGDRVLVRLGMRRGGGREGRMMALLSPGPGRASPPCPHFGRCGGCALQHLDPIVYRRAKLAALETALARAGLAPDVVEPLRTVPPGRRRARLGLARPRARQAPVRVGFRERFRHELVELRYCPVLEECLFALVAPLRRCASDLLPPGGTAEASLTRTDSGTDLLFEAAGPPRLDQLEILARFAEDGDLARIVWRGDRAEIPVVERRPVRLSLSGVAVPVPPGAFLQANAAAEAMLIEEVIGAARSALDTVVAVSCNPATFARDASRLVAGGFRLSRAVAIDQFVWTPHLEIAALFRR
jgi:23S rRNA (uracil1939-C5)-methyltransferase